MIQKIIKVGNSAAVTLNKQLLNYWDLSLGDYVETTPIKGEKKLLIEPVDKRDRVERMMDPEVCQVAKRLLRHYLPAFKKLANKS